MKPLIKQGKKGCVLIRKAYGIINFKDENRKVLPYSQTKVASKGIRKSGRRPWNMFFNSSWKSLFDKCRRQRHWKFDDYDITYCDANGMYPTTFTLRYGFLCGTRFGASMKRTESMPEQPEILICACIIVLLCLLRFLCTWMAAVVHQAHAYIRAYEGCCRTACRMISRGLPELKRCGANWNWRPFSDHCDASISLLCSAECPWRPAACEGPSQMAPACWSKSGRDGVCLDVATCHLHTAMSAYHNQAVGIWTKQWTI